MSRVLLTVAIALTEEIFSQDELNRQHLSVHVRILGRSMTGHFNFRSRYFDLPTAPRMAARVATGSAL